MKLQKLFPILTSIFFVSTCVLLYLQFFSSPTLSPALQPAQTEVVMSPEPPEQPKTSENPQISEEENRRLLDLENEQKELKLLLERVSADLSIATDSKQILDQLLLGRSVLRDFEKRFLNSRLFRKSGGFLNFLRQKTQAYLKDGELRVESSGIKKKELAQFRREVSSWLLMRTDEEIEGTSRFLSFFFAETLYEIPLTMLASRMTPELEEIDFDTPVLLQNVLTTASRDANGEMNETKPASLEKYSSAQQFFFRRGAKMTGKAVVFLKAYLSYTDI